MRFFAFAFAIIHRFSIISIFRAILNTLILQYFLQTVSIINLILFNYVKHREYMQKTQALLNSSKFIEKFMRYFSAPLVTVTNESAVVAADTGED